MSPVKFGRYGQWVAAVIVSISSFVSGTIFGWPSAAVPHMQDGTAGFTLNDSEISLVVAIASVSGFLSPIPCGYLMDTIGRRSTLIVFNLVVLASWGILAFSNSPFLISCSRFLGGLWGGVEYTAVQIYVGEIVEPKLRGSLGSLSELMLFGGAFFESAIARLPYNMITRLSAIPAVLLLLGLFLVPESPYFYLMKGQRSKATKTVIWLKGTCDVEDMNVIEDKVKEQLNNKAGFSEIFTSKANLKAFIIMETLKAIIGSSGLILLMSYATVILPDSFVSPQDSYVVLCIVWMGSGIVSGLVIDLVERRKLLYMSSVATMMAASCTAVWFYLRDKTSIDVSSTSWVPLVSLSLAGFFETGGIINIPNVIKSEIFAINIKSKASALCCMTAFLFEGINTYFFYDITNGVGLYMNFVKIVFTSGLCILVVRFALIETCGRTLEEIQDILDKGEREWRRQRETVDTELQQLQHNQSEEKTASASKKLLQ